MAKPLTPETGAVDNMKTGDNAEARDGIITECAEGLARIRATRRGLNEEAADIRKRVKDAEISTEAVDRGVRLLEREEEAREAYLEQEQLVFAALGLR